MTKDIKKKITDRLDAGDLIASVFNGKIIIRDRENPENKEIIEDVDGLLKVVSDWIVAKKDDKESRTLLHVINKPLHR